MSGIVKLIPLPSEGRWLLSDDIFWPTKGYNDWYVVPSGFLTDLMSVPRPFRILLNPANPRYARASIIHDHMVKNPNIPLAVASREFRICLTVDGVHPLLSACLAVLTHLYIKSKRLINNKK